MAPAGEVRQERGSSRWHRSSTAERLQRHEFESGLAGAVLATCATVHCVDAHMLARAPDLHSTRGSSCMPRLLSTSFRGLSVGLIYLPSILISRSPLSLATPTIEKSEIELCSSTLHAIQLLFYSGISSMNFLW